MRWMRVVCMMSLLVVGCGDSGSGSSEGDTADALSQDTGSAASGDSAVGGDSADTTPQDTADVTPGDTADTTPQDTADTTPGDTADTTPVDTSDTTPGDTADTTPVDTSDTTPVDTVDTTPVDTSDTTPQDTVDTSVGGPCAYECLDEAVCSLIPTSTEYPNMQCRQPNTVCCDLGVVDTADTADTADTSACIYTCMPRFQCTQMGGTEEADMVCTGQGGGMQVCCNVDTEAAACAFECVPFFDCDAQSGDQVHMDQWCENGVCCEAAQ